MTEWLAALRKAFARASRCVPMFFAAVPGLSLWPRGRGGSSLGPTSVRLLSIPARAAVAIDERAVGAPSSVLDRQETIHLDLERREIRVRGKGGRDRTVRIDHEGARRVDRYLRVRARHEQAYRRGLWLGTGGRGPLTANGIYQMVRRRGEQAGVEVHPHRFRHHFSHTWLDRGGAEGDLMELNGWSSPQMLQWYGGSVRGARARRHYDLIMRD